MKLIISLALFHLALGARLPNFAGENITENPERRSAITSTKNGVTATTEMTVSTYSEFKEALDKSQTASGTTINLAADIYLESRFPDYQRANLQISYATDLTVNGNGYKVDGVKADTCFVVYSSSVTMKNLTVTNCGKPDYTIAGAGFYVINSDVKLVGCTVEKSTSSSPIFYTSGGAMYAYDSQVFAFQTKFLDNTALLGGGLQLDGSTNANLSNCVMQRNTAAGIGPAQGGAIFLGSYFLDDDRIGKSGAFINLIGSTFKNNTAEAEQGGGDMFVSTSEDKFAVFSDCQAGEFFSGVGALLDISGPGSGVAYPDDLIFNTDTCTPCPEGQYSCCGALACSSTPCPNPVCGLPL